MRRDHLGIRSEGYRWNERGVQGEERQNGHIKKREGKGGQNSMRDGRVGVEMTGGKRGRWAESQREVDSGRICFWVGRGSGMLQWWNTRRAGSNTAAYSKNHGPFPHFPPSLHLFVTCYLTSLINLHLTPHFNLQLPLPPFNSAFLSAPAGEWADFRTHPRGGGQVGWASPYLSFSSGLPLFHNPVWLVLSSFVS